MSDRPMHLTFTVDAEPAGATLADAILSSDAWAGRMSAQPPPADPVWVELSLAGVPLGTYDATQLTYAWEGNTLTVTSTLHRTAGGRRVRWRRRL